MFYHFNNSISQHSNRRKRRLSNTIRCNYDNSTGLHNKLRREHKMDSLDMGSRLSKHRRALILYKPKQRSLPRVNKRLPFNLTKLHSIR